MTKRIKQGPTLYEKKCGTPNILTYSCPTLYFDFDYLSLVLSELLHCWSRIPYMIVSVNKLYFIPYEQTAEDLHCFNIFFHQE